MTPEDAAERAKHEAIDRVREHADMEWFDHAVKVGKELAEQVPFFTSDEIWISLEARFPTLSTHDPRAMGAVIRELMLLKVIERTDRMEKSRRRVNHARPVQVWSSLVYKPKTVSTIECSTPGLFDGGC